MKKYNSDYLILGGGIVGSSIAKNLAIKFPNKQVLIMEKDKGLGINNSILNSGVLHSGLYYPTNSNRSKYCIRGNKLLAKFHKDKRIPIRECGKLIIPKNELEVEKLHLMYNQGISHGIRLELLSNNQAKEIENNLKNEKGFPVIYSPDTSVGNPKQVMIELEKDLSSLDNVKIIKKAQYDKVIRNQNDLIIIIDKNGHQYETSYIINTAGLYADKIAKDFGLVDNLALVPLIGTYLLDNNNLNDNHKTLIYPVPPIGGNNFLGVHTTITVDGQFKLGPTALPCLWREQHKGFNSFNIEEVVEHIILYRKILQSNRADYFTNLLLTEIRKYYPINIIREAMKLVKSYDSMKFDFFSILTNSRFKYKVGGIRTQLLDLNNFELLNDFTFIKKDNHLHFLNIISPGWTSALAIAEDIDYLI